MDNELVTEIQSSLAATTKVSLCKACAYSVGVFCCPINLGTLTGQCGNTYNCWLIFTAFLAHSIGLCLGA